MGRQLDERYPEYGLHLLFWKPQLCNGRLGQLSDSFVKTALLQIGTRVHPVVANAVSSRIAAPLGVCQISACGVA
jgi:hypothetical protein